PRIGFDLFEKRSTLRFLARFAIASVFVGNGRCLILWVTLTNELADVLADSFLARSLLQGHMDHLTIRRPLRGQQRMSCSLGSPRPHSPQKRHAWSSHAFRSRAE